MPVMAQECSVAEELTALGTSRHGLGSGEAAARLAEHGRNELATPGRRRSCAGSSASSLTCSR